MCSAIKLTIKVKGVVSKTRESALNRVFPNTLKMIKTGKQPLFFSNIAFDEQRRENRKALRRDWNTSWGGRENKSIKRTRRGKSFEIDQDPNERFYISSRHNGPQKPPDEGVTEYWAWCVKRKYKHARLVEGALLLALLLLSFALSGFPCSCFLLLRRVEGFLTFCSALFLPFIWLPTGDFLKI